LNGTAFGNPISVIDVGGTPYFYVSLMDTSMQDVQKHPKVSLSLSEASVDCAKLTLDPEDPRCIRLSLSGTMVNVTSKSEFDHAKTILFEQHPAMKSWPADHGWLIYKLEIQDIWLVAKFGGPALLSTKDYFAAPAPDRGHPENPAHEPKHWQPLFTHKAKTARWLIRESDWATLATTSVHLNGTSFGNPISVSDGLDDNATGVPYMLLSTMDTSSEDLAKNAKCTLTFSQAEVNCGLHGIMGPLDPEDPRCTRLSLTGTMVDVTDDAEKLFAQKILVAKHPAMKDWLELKDFHFVKLQIEAVWLIDFFGGASHIAVEDYFKAAAAEMKSSSDPAPHVAPAARTQFV